MEWIASDESEEMRNRDYEANSLAQDERRVKGVWNIERDES